ncbi:Gfo/Idh/MocA family oxidoreductase [Pseudoalteromonas haloplanktis]|uniref:Gfo/Idh/MocA family oxidoreductase n=1 Tax=Pseudoalteromonas haloplanktis TaxID=228 RepID=A0ABU1B8X4_PSEHA|nr:Gfo/Idh/MocA family oxidoreductase [Pseudoalteromonas haloplanktis]MDQ9090883.1 Gfo/Idh/MocA family oxidoreductase [Pseudoalteromonas haloplanktis]
MRKLTIALVGLGDIAQKAYLPIVTQHAQIDPIFCTRNERLLSKLASQYRVEKHFTDYQDVLACKPDGVMIHTNTQSHYAFVKQALEKKIATFVDKPLAYSFSEVSELIELATKQNTPLFLGFNRRFLPIMADIAKPKIRHLKWQKNRLNLPAQPRTFIFDDFIHVVDSLCHFANVERFDQLNQLQVFSQLDPQGLLAAIHISFEFEGRLFQGAMDRLSGCNEEVVEITGLNEKWRIESLTNLTSMANEIQQPVPQKDWQPTLYKRGFESMLNAWLAAVKAQQVDQLQLKKDSLTHELCEWLVAHV